jgi:hypothetical protein
VHGQLRFESLYQGATFCTDVFVIRVLARHGPRQPFKRIAMFPVRPPKKNTRATHNSCAYPRQLNVRPGESTTYIAEVDGLHRVWAPAASSRFTVLIRP